MTRGEKKGCSWGDGELGGRCCCVFWMRKTRSHRIPHVQSIRASGGANGAQLSLVHHHTITLISIATRGGWRPPLCVTAVCGVCLKPLSGRNYALLKTFSLLLSHGDGTERYDCTLDCCDVVVWAIVLSLDSKGLLKPGTVVLIAFSGLRVELDAYPCGTGFEAAPKWQSYNWTIDRSMRSCGVYRSG